MSASEARDGYICLAVLVLLTWLLVFCPTARLDCSGRVVVRNPELLTW
jgi:hypothetical protein